MKVQTKKKKGKKREVLSMHLDSQYCHCTIINCNRIKEVFLNSMISCKVYMMDLLMQDYKICRYFFILKEFFVQ
jgi:hypothetical protein